MVDVDARIRLEFGLGEVAPGDVVRMQGGDVAGLAGHAVQVVVQGPAGLGRRVVGRIVVAVQAGDLHLGQVVGHHGGGVGSLGDEVALGGVAFQAGQPGGGVHVPAGRVGRAALGSGMQDPGPVGRRVAAGSA